MVQIGQTAKRLRESLRWTQRETATALGVSCVHLCNVENGKTQPSQALLDRYRELWGIDLYVLAWCEQGNGDELPPAVRSAASKLAKAWKQRIDALIQENIKDPETPCSTFDR
ncbi:MAG: helix-turn-helix domain-containing protein [Planctomycetota bacterium]